MISNEAVLFIRDEARDMVVETMMICGGNAVPLLFVLRERRSLWEKPRMEERRTPEQDKNGGTVFPVTAIKQVKTNQAVGRHFLWQQLFVIVAFLQ